MPAKESVELTAVIPERSRRAVAIARRRPKTEPPSPYGSALARSTASSTSRTLLTVTGRAEGLLP